MTNNDQRSSSRYQSPASIREESFQRGLRGLDADKVYEYLDLLADQVEASEKELSETRAENQRLQTELRRAQAALYDYEHVGDRVNAQVVEMFSQAQLVAEEMVQDVSRDARERVGQARMHEREIVQQAMDAAGQQVRSYALAAQAQMQAIMESFASDVDRLGNSPLPGDSRNGSRPGSLGSD
jgi:DivIVA domain-containing protein